MKPALQKLTDKYLLMAIAAMGSFLVFWNYGGPSIGLNELREVLSVQPGFTDIFQPNANQINDFAYRLLIWLWGNVFGFSTWSIRLPSVLFGIASIWLFKSIAYQHLNKWGAPVALALFVGSQSIIGLAQWAMPFAMAMMLLLLGAKQGLAAGADSSLKSNWPIMVVFGLLALTYLPAVLLGLLVVALSFFPSAPKKVKNQTAVISSLIVTTAVIFNWFFRTDWLQDVSLVSSNSIYSAAYKSLNLSSALFIGLLLVLAISILLRPEQFKWNHRARNIAIITIGAYLLQALFMVEVDGLDYSISWFFLIPFAALGLGSIIPQKQSKWGFIFGPVLLVIASISLFSPSGYFYEERSNNFEQMAQDFQEALAEVNKEEAHISVGIEDLKILQFLLPGIDTSAIDFHFRDSFGAAEYYKSLLQSGKSQVMMAWSGIEPPLAWHQIVRRNYSDTLAKQLLNGSGFILTASGFNRANSKKDLVHSKVSSEWQVTNKRIEFAKAIATEKLDYEYSATFESVVGELGVQPAECVVEAYAEFKSPDSARANLVIQFIYDGQEYWTGAELSDFQFQNNLNQVFHAAEFPKGFPQLGAIKVYVWNRDSKPLEIRDLQFRIRKKEAAIFAGW